MMKTRRCRSGARTSSPIAIGKKSTSQFMEQLLLGRR
jgi:hypothetical protein